MSERSASSDVAFAPPQPRKRGPLGRLYHGETHIDFIGRTKLWFSLSAIFLIIGLGSLATRGLNLGIDFEGGAIFQVPSNSLTVEQARDVVSGFGLGGAKIQEVTSESGRSINVQTDTLDSAESTQVRDALAAKAGVAPDQVSRNEVGPSWGKEISQKARNALVVFLIVITLYITLRFEFKMAVPTLAALVHDVLVTVGVYSLSGLEVTPATVVALLTILGYSIYDGIVVFDKVNENTRLVSATNGVTYSDMVNLSLNQTLMRSLNTSIAAVIPIMSLLGIGSLLLGAKTLQEFGLALLIGLISGAYSSIFIASPLLAIMKEREPRNRDVRRRIESRSATRRAAESEPVAAEPTATNGEEIEEPVPVPATAGSSARVATNIPPRPRKKGKRR
jgi:preprotein translocase subunit SecF